PGLPGPVAALLPSLIAGANAGVARYDVTPDARNYLDNYYAPTGRLQIPVVSVHNTWDYLAPEPVHEPAFFEDVQSAGALNMLLQRSVPNYGHCNFPTPLVVSSFQTLVDWVTTGVKPAS
ncbi:MAG: hypothetical protein ACM3SX_23220, partial [Deltaproteobacteria bacterium]